MKYFLLIIILSTRAHAQHSHDAVNHRGDQVMGFSHQKTTHHFFLSKDGGSIQVTANASNDQETIDAIRLHLNHIAIKFSAGDFTAPMLIHATTPPGVPTLQKRKSQITYTFDKLPTGGLVRISTKNPDTLKAIHEFLKFQIQDHHTGDPQSQP